MFIYPSTKILPYVYRLDNPQTGEFYIGSRYGNKSPSTSDIGTTYFTSSKYVKPRFDEFKITIIAEFFNKEDAVIFEQIEIKENWNNPLILNRNICYNGTREIKILGGSHGESVNRKISNTLKEYFKNPKARFKVSESLKGKTPSHKGVTNLFKHTEETKIRIGNRTRGKSQEKVTCPHCGKSGGYSLMPRWHFDNCKSKL